MANIILHRKIDNRHGLGAEIFSFINKLAENPANPSLHIEPIKNARDKRVRTGRINDKYRAVLFELNGKGEQHFVIADVLNHDDAYVQAVKISLSIDPTTGVTSIQTLAPLPTPEEIEAEIQSRAAAIAAEKVAEQAIEQEAIAPVRILAEHGITEKMLSDELGLSPLSVNIVMRAKTEAETQELLAAGPSWEADAVLGLLAGMSIKEVREDLGLDSADKPEIRQDDDASLIDGLQTAAAKMDFVFGPDEEELRNIIETGSFAAWRIFLHPSQEKAVRAKHSGSARILGGAGTGKTVVVVHRANHLVTRTDLAPRVLLTTYTRDLANSLKSQMNLLNPGYPEAPMHSAPGLWISGIDALANSILGLAQVSEITAAFESELGVKFGKKPGPLYDKDEARLWDEAVIVSGENLAPEKRHSTFLSQEYAAVILTNRIVEEGKYLRVSRAGRGTPLSRSERKSVWNIVQAFHAKCRAEGRFTFAALAAVAAGIISARKVPMFDHVLVDEAQDFHAGHWRLLRAVVASGPDDIFIAEDSHQRIYGQRLVLSRFGIETRGGASRRLNVNYRTTAQNLRYASAVLDGTEWLSSTDEPDDLTGYRSAFQGPEPIILHSDTEKQEAEKLAEQIKLWIDQDPNATIGILSRTKKRRSDIIAQLSDLGLESNTRHDANSVTNSRVSFMTWHNAKGLEFTHVALLDVSDTVVPPKYMTRGLAEAEQQDAIQRERALLYVAASRARDQLLVSIVGKPSSLLPR